MQDSDWEEDEYCGRECYVFNKALRPQMDDECCEHCAKFLTLDCKYIEEFLEEEEA
ncbi:MAG: hypothetical protein AB1665_05125 [Candidatus Thermoplasmatota archaeon]